MPEFKVATDVGVQCVFAETPSEARIKCREKLAEYGTVIISRVKLVREKGA